MVGVASRASMARTLRQILRLPERQPRPAKAKRVYLVAMDDLVALAQQGWEYPLADDDQTRADIRDWLERRGLR